MRIELEDAFDNDDIELFKKIIKPTDNIDSLLSTSIGNYKNDFAKFIIMKFNKYKESGQQALENNNIEILKLYI